MPDERTRTDPTAAAVGASDTHAALFHVLRAAIARLRNTPLATPFQGAIDGPAFAEAVVEHGLAALVTPVVTEALAAAPTGLGKTLGQYAAAAALQCALLERRLLEVSVLLRAAGLPHLALKGVTLAALSPPTWPPRQASDIDLLLADDDALERATELLSEHGFEVRLRLPWERHLLRPEDGTVLDLHREVVPRHLPRPFDFAALWARRQPLAVAGGTVDTPGRSDTFVLLCLHLFKDALDVRSGFAERVRLDKVADLARFCHQGDWQALERYAATLGCERIAQLALAVADQACDLGLPSDLRSRLADNPLRRSFPDGSCWLLAASAPLGEGEQILIQLRLRDRLLERLALLVTPNDEDRRNFPLPPQLAPLRYLLRPVRLAAKGTLALGRLARERGTP